VYILDVEIVGFDVGHLVAAGGEGGKHERGGLGGLSSELAEVAGGDVLNEDG
jgi:hypothetical protein